MKTHRCAITKFLSIGLLVAGNCAFATTIFVTSTSGANNVGGACVLRDALTAANTQTAVGGCAAGSSGTNVIELPPGGSVISLTDIDNSDFNPSTGYGANGLPIIQSTMTIHGNGATIERSLNTACNGNGLADPGEFRLLMIALASVEIDDATLRNGCADFNLPLGLDGAIKVNGDSSTVLLLRRVRVTDNFASAIPAIGQSAGSLRLEYSTVDHNAGGSLVGKITAADPADPGCQSGGHVDLRIFNSTISDNAEGQATVFGCGTLQIENSTFAGNLGSNTLDFKAAPNVAGGISIKNSIFADNVSADCKFYGEESLSILGDNISRDASCPQFSLPNTNAHLAPLGRYGGPTPTRAPLSASPAIDAVSDCTRADGTPVSDDQRGTSRPLLGHPGDPVRCDIGAVEYDGNQIFIDGFD